MPEVKLSITPIEGSPDNYKVEISGSGVEFAANKEVRWKLKGDDHSPTTISLTLVAVVLSARIGYSISQVTLSAKI